MSVNYRYILSLTRNFPSDQVENEGNPHSLGILRYSTVDPLMLRIMQTITTAYLVLLGDLSRILHLILRTTARPVRFEFSGYIGRVGGGRLKKPHTRPIVPTRP